MQFRGNFWKYFKTYVRSYFIARPYGLHTTKNLATQQQKFHISLAPFVEIWQKQLVMFTSLTLGPKKCDLGLSSQFALIVDLDPT